MIEKEEKLKELKQIISSLQYDMHTSEENGYDFLETEDVFVSIQNKNNNVQLALQMGGINTIFFGGGRFDFANDEAGFDIFLNNISKIVSGELNVISLSNLTLTDTALSSCIIDENSDRVIILGCFKDKNYNLRKLKKAKTQVRIFTWTQGLIKSFSL